ncbi:MAG TPA: aminotransferase class I/II-fold pyridoxal phosphate-dependent enzyme [Terriglobia bacterium]|nr:aminotransferase class I/II-fold pyridoxal phosphate-dependent enzyme [Terriglobia bacterium]
MTRLAMEHDAVNLAQGFPDFPAPAEVKEAAVRAIRADVNQYAITWGARDFRRAVAERFRKDTGLDVDPERELTVCCGATETMIASLLAVVDPGEEVIVFEPFYENYGPDAIICGAAPRFVRLRPPVAPPFIACPERSERGGMPGVKPGATPPTDSNDDWTFDPAELAAAFNERTRALVLNTPNNPTGKVFTAAELETIAACVRRSNAYVLTDEIYQYMVYDGRRHVSFATLPGMRERTITINGMSKTYSVTGWRVGYAIAPPEVSNAIRKMHDFLTVGAAAPLQEAGVTALGLPEEYYQKLRDDYTRRRDRMLAALDRAGFRAFKPRGAYYIMTDISGFGFPNDVEFTKYLIREIGVAVVPGSSFYNNSVVGPGAGPGPSSSSFPRKRESLTRRQESPNPGSQQVRFCFCKTDQTLDEAARRLEKLRPR